MTDTLTETVTTPQLDDQSWDKFTHIVLEVFGRTMKIKRGGRQQDQPLLKASSSELLLRLYVANSGSQTMTLKGIRFALRAKT